ncbi:uncharacterized protein LOC122882930 isoform X1 [Siniperca chuatsi]|uniref:uncharacterized protein LOC122882930 isoform X1 n=1 Tax=Siniperca chuatsi TaxID=119488 RepID=UPI001CE14448|nr:uncharacterized protein LOC122882930 isoform X1 [Siniperca chuatsi]
MFSCMSSFRPWLSRWYPVNNVVLWWATEPPRSLYVSLYLSLLVCSGCPLSVLVCKCGCVCALGWFPHLPSVTDYQHTWRQSSLISTVYLLDSSTLPGPDHPPYIHFRSASDYRLSLPFRSPGPQLPHHFRHRADLHLRTLPAIHTTRPAPVIFHLVGSVFPLRSPAWSLLTLSPSGVPSVTPPTRLCRILGEATGDAGLSIHQCQ